MSNGFGSERSPARMRHFVVDLARPYGGWLLIILFAMMVETATSLAGPWPLKIVIDNALDSQSAPAWLVRLLGPALASNGPALAAAAAAGLVLLAALGGIASYVDNYFTESVGQWVANDAPTKTFVLEAPRTARIAVVLGGPRLAVVNAGDLPQREVAALDRSRVRR